MTTPVLNIKKVTCQQISTRDLGRFICEVYQINEYEICANEEWTRDALHLVSVEKQSLYEWDLEKIRKVKAGEEPSFSLRAVMTDLCNQGLIEPGSYLIDAR
jgi:hypothetical protein